MNEWAFDIETKTDFKTFRLGGLFNASTHPTTSWCTCLPTQRVHLHRMLEDGDRLYTYNGEGFDYRVINFEPKELESKGVKLIDGYILSKILYPDRKSHSLASWAKELLGEEEQKLEVDYDNAPISELQTYCQRDLDITVKVVRELYARYSRIFTSDTVLRVEQGVRRLVNDTYERGFGFDIGKAADLISELTLEMAWTNDKAKAWLPKMPLPPSKLDTPPKRQINADGSISKAMCNFMHRNCGEGNWEIAKFGDGKFYAEYTLPHSRMSPDIAPLPLTEPMFTAFQTNLSNTKELKQWALEQGWKPTMYNKNKEGKQTSPMFFEKTTGDVCPNLVKVLGTTVTDELRTYSVCSSRLNTVKGLFERQDDGVIYADADTCGTPTARFRHRSIVNIPRATTKYGPEMRALFGPVDKTNLQVGWDASGLESVMEAHYVYPFDPDYAKELVTGDVHQRNMDKLGFPNRDVAKRFKYAVMYGARPARLASTLSVSERQARIWYDDFWKVNTGLSHLVSHINAHWKGNYKKFVTGLDGRPLYTRHEHALLNTLLQGGGAILMKYAFLLANRYIKSDYPDLAFPLIRYHDEEQWECVPEIAHSVGSMGVSSIEDAGRALKLRVPITGEYKIGDNWGECH